MRVVIKCEDFCIAYKHIPSVTVAEALKNQIDRVTWPVSVLSALGFPSLRAMGSQWSNHGGTEGGYAWSQKQGHPLSKADLTTAAAESQPC